MASENSNTANDQPGHTCSVKDRDVQAGSSSSSVPFDNKKVPVPMPRSLSSMRFTRKVIVQETTETRVCYEEKLKRRSRSLDDIFDAQNQKTYDVDIDGNQYSRIQTGKMTEQTGISRQYSKGKIPTTNFRGLPKADVSALAMSDCVPSPSSDSSYGPSSGSNSSSDSSSSPSCEISLVERLIRTHPVWFLPSLQRSGALHLLQGREMGNFIVRSSTQPLTMAVSVKLPGNHVEHYLLKAVDNRIALENSTHTFETVHQLIAHYCTLSDEIPVCLRVPNAIAEATTRQQLRSLALLGQEFWTHASNGSGKELSSPSDAEVSKNFISSGLGSQSSSSQNSLCDLRKPCRPTTLELNALVSGGGGVGSGTPPPVPPRWSRSNLLTPMSLPSSIQSTPSEVQSTFSEKSGRVGKKKKRHSGGKSESIHYKDTEILALFKGTKTSYDDKASDYEDIWSPQYSGKTSLLTAHTCARLSTFKPDLIASSLGSEDSLYTRNKSQFPANSALNNNERSAGFTSTQINNNKNNRLSFNRSHLSQINQNEVSLEGLPPVTKDSSTNNSTREQNSKPSLYSEPVDSITFRRFGNYRHSEPNIRWSQPAMMSLVNVETDFIPESILKPKPQLVSTGSINSNKLKELHRSSLANVSINNGTIPEVTNEGREVNRNNQRSHGVSCASVDNLCHLRDFKRKAKKFSCGASGEDGSDEEEDVKLEEKVESPMTQTIITTSSVKPPQVKPQPAPRKKSTDIMTQKEHQEEHDILDISNNRSWRLDNSWEFVMWEKGEEERMAEGSSLKFPIAPQLMSPNNNSPANLVEQKYAYQKSEEGLNDSNGSNIDSHRFSRYDNLESRENFEEEGSVDGDEASDADRDEKISAPWDSSKWEHLLRLVSESTQQLDSLQLSENGTHERHNKNLFLGEESKDHRESRLLTESRQRISKIMEVSGNVDKASRVISSVVRGLAEKDNGFFGPTLKSFITCTISAKIQDPYKVMRNIRQFISGMKNYLVGVSLESAELRLEIKKQTELLTDCEFLNIDAILEDILVDLVISPLNSHIRGLIELHHSKLALNKESHSPGIAFCSSTESQKQEILEKLKKIIEGFEENVSPIKKLDKWNEFVCQVQEMENYSSESFLPLLADMLSTVCSSNLPSDVDYMIGLLPHSLAEQNNYSLSLLQSAVASLRSKVDRKGSFTLTSVRVIVPDERNGTLIRKMVPIRETTTTKEVAKMVASKVGISNLGDYVLVRIRNGEEKLCPDGELVSNFLEDSQTALAYKRVDAKIGWPQRMS